MASDSGAASGESFVEAVIDQGRFGGRQLLIVGLCLLFNMLDGFDITAMAIVASDVAAELSLPPEQLGIIFSFALAGMMAGAMFLAPISDLLGRRLLIVISIGLVGASIVLTANASSLTEFKVLRFISGLGAGAMLACQAALAAEYSPERYRAAAVAIVTSGYPLGAMFTAIVAGQVMPEFGWRGMFWFGGSLTLLMVIVAWLFIPESIKYLFERRPDNALQRINAILAKFGEPALSELPSSTPSTRVARPGLLSNVAHLFRAQRWRKTLILWPAFFLCFCTLYFLMSWIPNMMDAAGYDPAVGRRAFFLFNLGGVLGIYLISYLSTRFRLTNLIFALCVVSALMMIAYAYVSSSAELWLLFALILMIGIFQQGGFTGLYSAAAKAYPTEFRSTGIGWAIGLGRLGAVTGPAIAGYLIAAGASMATNFVYFAVPMAIGGFIAFLLRID